MHTGALTFLILSISSSLAWSADLNIKTLKEAETYTGVELQSYRQTGYQVEDPAGDYALLKRSELVPKRIIQDLMGKEDSITDTGVTHDEEYELNAIDISVPGTKSDPGAPKSRLEELAEYCSRNPEMASLYSEVYKSFGEDPEEMEKLLVGVKNMGTSIQGREDPLNREGLSNMFAQVINEERENGIEPSYGTPHEWSKEFLDKHGRSSPMLVSSKLLMALAVGETNRYMKTEKEEDLYKWFLAQDDNSLDLDKVFRQSYKLNSGDMYKTLLTIENVMGHQWRNNKRESLPFIKKLKPITSGHEYKDDKFGTWYHLFGIMLYGYVEGGIKANIMGKVEALGSVVLSPGVNKTQKAWMNKSGGLVGGDLAKLVKEKSYTSVKSDKSNLSPEKYLNKKEDFRDRIAVKVDKDIEISMDEVNEHTTFIYIKDNKKRDFKNCSVDVIPDTGTGLDSRETDTTTEVSLKRRAVVQLPKVGVKKIRGFVKCENSSESMVFEHVVK